MSQAKASKAKEEPGVAADVQIRHAAVVSSTFANMELHTTRQTLDQYTLLFNDARDEIKRLQEEAAERERDNIKVVNFLRTENEDLKDSIKKMKKEFGATIERLEKQHSDLIDELKSEMSEREATIKEQQATIEQLHADLEALAAFRRERHAIHIEIANYKQRQADTALAHEEALNEVKFNALEERVRLRAEEKQLRETFQREVTEEAQKMLDSKTKEIYDENTVLRDDCSILQRELDRITAENKALTQKNKKQRQEVELAKVADEEYSKKCARQSLEIKSLKQQLHTLEAAAEKNQQDNERNTTLIRSTLGAQIEKLKIERDSSTKHAEGRHRELTKMRQLARTIVQQRTELETFFNEALMYVRKQIALERSKKGLVQLKGLTVAQRAIEDRRFPHSAPSKIPLLPAIPKSGSQEKAPESPGSIGTMIDISDLSWEEKERVLRILFAKINAQRSDGLKTVEDKPDSTFITQS